MTNIAPPDRRGQEDDSDSLFREEAMQEYVRGRLEGRLLRVSPAWASWVFWLLLATFAGAALFLFFAEVDHVVSGPAVVRRSPSMASGDLEVVALFPGNTRARVHADQTISIRWDGLPHPPLELRIQDIAPEIVGPERARDLLGEDVSDIVDISGPVVFVRAGIPATLAASSSDLVPGVWGVADVRIGRHRLLEELLPEISP